jgi:hypothetical protein
MAEVIPFPIKLVAAANIAARAVGDRPAPGTASAEILPLPTCRSVEDLEERLDRLKEKFALEISRANPPAEPVPFLRLARRRLVDAYYRTRPGEHWSA